MNNEKYSTVELILAGILMVILMGSAIAAIAFCGTSKQALDEIPTACLMPSLGVSD